MISARRIVSLGLMWCLLATAAASALGAEPTITIHANRTEVYLGESVGLTVKVEGDINAPQPKMSAIRNCDVKFTGSQAQNFTSILIVNGRRRATGFVGRIYSYEVTPKKAGKIRLGPVTVSSGGRVLKAPGPDVNVVGVQKQEWVYVKLVASRNSVLVDEPFDITLSVGLKCMQAPHDNIHPLFRTSPPRLRAAFLDLAPIKGLQSPNIDGILRQYLVRSGVTAGFSINNYVSRRSRIGIHSMFDFDDPFSEKPLTFRFDHEKVTEDGKRYFEYRLKLTYTPREEGQYTFGPVTFKGDVAIAVDRNSDGVPKRIFAVGRAVTVRVVPPPEEGRPVSYIGAIGTNLVAEVALDTQICKQGDPLKLTLSISGDVSLDNVFPPRLSAQTNLSTAFRITEDTVYGTRKEGRIEYVYTVRPTQAGTIELPPVDVSYYNAKQRRYLTVKTSPSPIKVYRARQVGPGNVEREDTNRIYGPGQEPTHDKLTIAPLIMTPAGAIPTTLFTLWHAVILALGPICYVLVVGGQTLVLHLRQSRPERIRRRAHVDALSFLRLARKRGRKDAASSAVAIRSAFRDYLAQRFDATGAALTPADVSDLLLGQGISVEVAKRTRSLLERHFNNDFSPASDPTTHRTDDFSEAQQLIEDIESETDSESTQ